MEERLIKVLKSLKLVSPDDGFIHRSRQILFASEQKPAPARFVFSFSESFRLAAALAMASILLFIALGGLSYLHLGNLSPSLLTKAGGENLKSEMENLNFQIQLGQAKYDLGNEKSVGLDIDELLKNLSL